MDAERLEILISSYLDSEITADEQLELEAELERNPESQGLLNEMLQMHEATQEAFATKAGQSKSFEEIYSSAQKQNKPKNIAFSWLKFSSGLAAGLFVGLFLQFGSATAPNNTTTKNYQLSPAGVAPVSYQSNQGNQNRQGSPVIRNVDVYHYTDKNGNQYILTGYRDNVSGDEIKTTSF